MTSNLMHLLRLIVPTILMCRRFRENQSECGRAGLACVTDQSDLRERKIDGTQIITKQDRAPDDATAMIEVPSQQLRKLYRAETHRYYEQVSRVRQKMRRAVKRPSVLRTSTKMKLSSLRR